MVHSESFTFITILNESFKLLYKNLKPIATITTISLTILSFLILSFSYSIQFLPNDFTIRLWSFFVLEIIFLLPFFAITVVSRISIVLISANSYTGKNLLLRDLFPIIKSTYKQQTKTSSYVSRFTIPYSILIVILSTVILCTIITTNPNFTTISTSIVLGIIGSLLQLYFSVVFALALIVSVIEDECYGKKAVERAKELVQGQRVHGFLINLLVNLVGMIPIGGYWMMVGMEGLMNMDFTIFALFSVNFLYLFQILMLVAYTAFYFLCKKHSGEEMIGYDQYSKLPNVQMANDIP